MAPLRCTSNTQCHFDYQTPLVANKSTDYRTSTGKNHRFIPSIAQDFDCRVLAQIKPELLEKNIAIKNDWKSTYEVQYPRKQMESDLFSTHEKAPSCKSVDYVINAQEKIFQRPAANRVNDVSEMKDNYQMNYWRPKPKNIHLNTKCPMEQIFQSVQSNLCPQDKGYYKLLDIYVTENRSKFIPYNAETLKKAQEDLVTFYNANGNYKRLKEPLPGKLHGFKNVYDKAVFKKELPYRLLHTAPKRVPNFGMKSEYQSNYFNQTCSNFSPYIQEHPVFFTESLSGPSPWQNLCPPGMYCSEYSHIGTGWPVRSVVDINKENI